MMSCPQFNIRALLVATLVVAAFFAGVAYNRRAVHSMQAVVRSREEAADKAAKQLREAVEEIENLQRRL